MCPIKEELIYTDDPTTIGRWVELEDNEGGRRYEPVLRFNFMVLGYISSPDDSFRGFMLLMNVEGKKFTVVHSLVQVKLFKKLK